MTRLLDLDRRKVYKWFYDRRIKYLKEIESIQCLVENILKKGRLQMN